MQPGEDKIRHDFDELVQQAIQFRDDRDWAQFHDPKNLAEGLSIEAAELLEIFLWKTTEQSKNPSQAERGRIQDELGDIFIFMIYLCREYDLDQLEATADKIKQNGLKYPVHKSRGNAKKYTEHQEE